MRVARGEQLNRQWRVGAKHALYREDGRWYHQLRSFPGVLFDKSGYILFETRGAYFSSPYLQIRKDLHVPAGIASIPGYVPLPTEIVQRAKSRSSQIAEGGVKEVIRELVTRNKMLRRKALEIHGTKCQICGFDFSEFYGELGGDYVEVHHLTPISDAKERRATASTMSPSFVQTAIVFFIEAENDPSL